MELSIKQALQQALTAHKEGKLKDAERLYRAILHSRPFHSAANHNLGVIAVSVNKINEALPLFKNALEANPQIEQFWLSYIDALIKEKQFNKANEVLELGKKKGISRQQLNILELQLLSKNKFFNFVNPPKEQLNSLLELYQTGRDEEAEQLAVSLTKKFPNSQFGWKVLGVILFRSGRINDSLIVSQKSVQLASQDAEAHSNLGNTLKKLGRLKEAETSYNQAITLKPNYAKSHNNLGIILKELGRLDEAEVSYRKAIALNSEYAEAHNNLGATLKELGRLSEAEASYTEAITLKPDYTEAYNNLGNVLKEFGRLVEAVARYKEAIAMNPNLAETHYNLAITFQDLGRLDEAEVSYRKAIALKSDYSDAFWNLHGIQKTLQAAEHWIDKCLEADKNYIMAKLTKVALRFYQGDRKEFDDLMQSELRQHPYVRSLSWAFSLPSLPQLHFDKWYFFDAIIKKSIVSRPFYEFGVWRASSFKYFIKFFKKGYGFDTFTGLPEDWDVGSHIEKKGSYTNEGNVPKIRGGEFIVGKFEDTLPIFFSKSRPIASVINFDADLYSSTICALNFTKSIIDQNTLLIFDEFIMNESWEQDEFKALNEFCYINNYKYEVIAISFFTKQVAVKLISI